MELIKNKGMREIKFRAFDTATKKMLVTGFHVIGEVTAFGIIEQMLMEEPLGKTTLERMGDVEIMQFTGLFDKNGTEIYEGDIVKVPQDYIKPIAVYWNNEMTGFYPLLSERSIHLTVIGNLYQNPELCTPS